jgi:hypothetical protein
MLAVLEPIATIKLFELVGFIAIGDSAWSRVLLNTFVCGIVDAVDSKRTNNEKIILVNIFSSFFMNC